MTLFTTILIVCGKVNFSNLSRYSSLNEKTYRRQFEQAFDFIGLNLSIVEASTATGQSWIGVRDSSLYPQKWEDLWLRLVLQRQRESG
ncbi:MAG: hypothetical protein J0L70_27370 [Leptolyngbya sp. UWPOB_LEPTO1]|uniref:hypothetical protein n=1 Tax=Leptolyngbya sp. UWPOB_LEPTO1 TaxID=2815653 RepID=UPI001AD3F721|nr:hypothetical protein [Leptolyngbya sp. UWPOB_LEPTO1]MBN8564258.1 hypothetical protein [Leptolyngbya sp. UWPOB_LEPTO1]